MNQPSLYRVVVSEKTSKMLMQHIQFVAKENIEAAKKTKKEITEAIISLYEMSHRFPFLNTSCVSPNKYHKLFVQKWYLVLYQVKDQTVYVDYILDCRQDYGWLIR
ncbi:MAG: type II toxin-antitoxin system RelE/ParE family toxin [Caldisericia bacterium]|nr:type II toxin-antitoxin system RelE/ParE family toxin [Caldisericia bacterium]MDD4614669.1 type II toxin-antitoxin system RelE/ParE family toxin [Caldisericia bacterium]